MGRYLRPGRGQSGDVVVLRLGHEAALSSRAAAESVPVVVVVLPCGLTAVARVPAVRVVQ